MRFFVALEIPKENLPAFQAIQSKLHTLIPQTKLTSLDKIHLTLAFIGEQPEELKINLIKIITNAAREIPAFTVTPAYLDGFPEIHHPLILWIGVKGDIDKIHLLRERIKDGLETLHLPVDERRFVPHISIAKFNKPFPINNGLEENLQEMMARQFNPIQISSIKLFESVPENPARRLAFGEVDGGQSGGGLHTHNTLAEIKLF